LAFIRNPHNKGIEKKIFFKLSHVEAIREKKGKLKKEKKEIDRRETKRRRRNNSYYLRCVRNSLNSNLNIIDGKFIINCLFDEEWYGCSGRVDFGSEIRFEEMHAHTRTRLALPRCNPISFQISQIRLLLTPTRNEEKLKINK